MGRTCRTGILACQSTGVDACTHIRKEQREGEELKRKWINRVLTGMVIVHLVWSGPQRALPQAPPSASSGQAPPAAPPAAPATPAPQAPEASPAVPIALHLENADLLQVVGIIAAELKMNYVVDP